MNVIHRCPLMLTLPSWNESEKKIKIFQLGEDKGLSSKFIHAYILPGVWRTCVINADRRSIRNLAQNFSSAGSPVRKAISSIAHLKTQWDIDTTARCLAAGLNLKTGQLLCHYIAEISLHAKLKHKNKIVHEHCIPVLSSVRYVCKCIKF